MNDFEGDQEYDFDYENDHQYNDDECYLEYDPYTNVPSIKNRLKWWAWRLRISVMQAPRRLTHRCLECGKPGFPYCKDHEIPF
jgi:hypothetical protein